MITLYHSTHSTCSQKVRICLAEKGLTWTGHHLNLRAFDQLKPEFLALNSAGLVPVLVDGGQVLTESRIINEYLEDAYAQPRLSPESAHARARMRLWTKYADDVASEAVKLPSFVKNIQPGLQRMPREEALATIARIPNEHIRARWRKAATEGISADDLKPSIGRLTEMVERMDDALQDAPWLAGEEYSLADIDIAPFVQRLVRIDLFGLVAARPRVNDWYARITSRPTYASAMPPAGSEGGSIEPA
ncbi:glutathione S-transferase family protein [Ottowia thiooxydans]|uniref:glutathione S-transferase family protein n=1 Tax=Ottowia thiooxydans TaxID=219182 RepID=UPI0004063F32|nr:glutathione S-transferase family protein [Ottowia thiooxydans]